MYIMIASYTLSILHNSLMKIIPVWIYPAISAIHIIQLIYHALTNVTQINYEELKTALYIFIPGIIFGLLAYFSKLSNNYSSKIIKTTTLESCTTTIPDLNNIIADNKTILSKENFSEIIPSEIIVKEKNIITKDEFMEQEQKIVKLNENQSKINQILRQNDNQIKELHLGLNFIEKNLQIFVDKITGFIEMTSVVFKNIE